MLRIARDYGAQARTASGANILLGVWLLCSPWAFGYDERGAILNSMIVGALIAAMAALRIASLHKSAGYSGINLLLALWTVASPWSFMYANNQGALVNNVIVGVLVAVLALWSVNATEAEQRHRPRLSAH